MISASYGCCDFSRQCSTVHKHGRSSLLRAISTRDQHRSRRRLWTQPLLSQTWLKCIWALSGRLWSKHIDEWLCIVLQCWRIRPCHRTCYCRDVIAKQQRRRQWRARMRDFTSHRWRPEVLVVMTSPAALWRRPVARQRLDTARCLQQAERGPWSWWTGGAGVGRCPLRDAKWAGVTAAGQTSLGVQWRHGTGDALRPAGVCLSHDASVPPRPTSWHLCSISAGSSITITFTHSRCMILAALCMQYRAS